MDLVGDTIVETFTVAGSAQTRRHNLTSLVAGRCCKGCNGGWMGDLEIECSPILTDLLSRTRTLDELSSAERETVGAWTLKTSYALLSVGRHWENVPQEHLALLREFRRTPEGVRILGTHVEASHQYMMRSFRRWELMGKPSAAELEKLTSRSYKVLLHFGDLILLAAYLPVEGWHLGARIGRHFPVSGTTPPIKWLDPLYDDTGPTSMLEGTASFATDLFAMQDDVPVGRIVRRGEPGKSWRVLPEPSGWTFAKRRGLVENP